MNQSDNLIVEHSALCINNCGYYGNANWQGLCSICWNKKNNLEVAKTDQRITTSNTSDGLNERVGIRRRIIQKIKNNALLSGYQRLTQDGNVFSIQHSEVELNVIRFLTKHRFKHIASINPEFYSLIRHFIESAYEYINIVNIACNVDIVASEFNKFYHNIKCWISERYPELSIPDAETLFNSVEDCLFRIMYGSLFSLIYSECEKVELQLQRQFKIFHWIKPEMLKLKADNRFWKHNALAIQELNKIDHEITPFDKLSAILKCCKAFISYEQSESNEYIDADDLLPQLIYVLLNARPIRLHTNLTFISKFTEHEKLHKGQHGYSFTTMKCAQEYILNLKYQQLGVTEKEFKLLVKSPPLHCGDIFATARLSQTLDALVLASEADLYKYVLEQKQKRLHARVNRLHAMFKSFHQFLIKDIDNNFPFFVSEEDYSLKQICDIVATLNDCVDIVIKMDTE